MSLFVPRDSNELIVSRHCSEAKSKGAKTQCRECRKQERRCIYVETVDKWVAARRARGDRGGDYERRQVNTEEEDEDEDDDDE